jgi:dihydroflavonol-4-reductase
VRTVVTGAAGFIGRRLVSRLLARGDEVIAVVRRDAARLPAPARVERIDITRPDGLGRILEGAERLYHLAALVTFDPRERGRLRRVNADGTRHVLDASVQADVERIVLVSSAATLGVSPASDQLLDEEAQPAPRVVAANPYLASKLEAEQAAIGAAARQHVVIVNPTTVYGPGDHSLNSGTLIRQVATAPALPVPPGGGNVVDVDDVVDGILLAGEHGRPGRRYLLGAHNLRFSEILARVAGVVGRRPLLVPVPRWSRGAFAAAAWALGRVSGSRLLTPQIVGDLFSFKFYSCRRAHQELGWQPRVPFDDSVARAWDYYRGEGLL